MVERKGDFSNKTLTIILSFLILAITILISSIIVVHNNLSPDNEPTFTEIITANESSLKINNDIIYKLNNDENYYLSNAEQDFKTAIDQATTLEKIYLSIYYAEFNYSAYEDIDKAIDILKKVEDLPAPNNVASDFYAAMANLYNEAGNTEEYNHYLELSNKLKPNTVIDSKQETKNHE